MGRHGNIIRGLIRVDLLYKRQSLVPKRKIRKARVRLEAGNLVKCYFSNPMGAPKTNMDRKGEEKMNFVHIGEGELTEVCD